MLVAKETVEKLTRLRRSLIDSNGREIPNPKPLSMPSGLDRPPTIQEQIKRVLRTELSQQALMQGEESFEEANDFEVNDEFEEDLVDTQYTIMTEEFYPDVKEGEDGEDKQEMAQGDDAPEQKEPEIQVEKENSEGSEKIKS